MMQAILIIILLLACLLTTAWIVGSRLPRTQVAASRIRLRAEIAKVWETLTDFEHYPEWRMGLWRVELRRGKDDMPAWTEICSERCKIPFQVVEMHPPHRLVTQMADPKLPLTGRWTYELKEENGFTVLTITETDRIHHPLFRFFTRYVISPHGAIDVFLTELALRLDRTNPEIEHLQPRHPKK